MAAAGRLVLHASAIESASGVIAFVGRSGAGKSTLAAASVAAGYRYVADEITAVDPRTLDVLPFARPIGIRRGGAAALGIDYPKADDGRFDLVYPLVIDEPNALSDGGRLAGLLLVGWSANAQPGLASPS